MKFLITFIFLLSPFFSTLKAACEVPSDLADYQIVEGGYNLHLGGIDTVSPGLYVKGDVVISSFAQFTGNIYATGDVTVAIGATVNGSVFAEGNTSVVWNSNVIGEECPNIAPFDYCENPPDVSNYAYYEGEFSLDNLETYSVPAGKDGLYVKGEVELKDLSQFNGDIYATKKIDVEDRSTLNGNAYGKKEVHEHDQGEIVGQFCENGDALLPPSGPTNPAHDFQPIIDELINNCSEIFPYPIQSHVYDGELEMEGDSIIKGGGTEFSFPLEDGIHNESCLDPISGLKVQCKINGHTSKALTVSFKISAHNGSNIDIKVKENRSIIIGDDENDLRFKKIEVKKNARLEFVARPGEIYEIDELIVEDNAEVSFAPGEYAIYKAEFKHQSNIEASGSETVYLFIEDDFKFDGSLTTEAAKFSIVVNSEVEIKAHNNKETHLKIYANDDITIKGDGDFYGAFSGSDLEIKDKITINYENVCEEEVRMCEIPGWEAYNPTQCSGDMVVSGANIYTCNGSPISNSGNAFDVSGTVTLLENTEATGLIYAQGDITLGKNARYSGWLHTEGCMTLGEGAVVGGSTCASCTPPDDDYQFEIITSPDALTCEAHPVAIIVRNDDGSIATDYTGLVSLATTPPLGIWSLLNGAGILTDSGNIDGKGTYQFDSSDQGTVRLGLFNEIATELSVLVTGGGVDSNPVAINFRPFQLKATIPAFTTANLPFDMSLTAVGKDLSGAGCAVIEEYTGAQKLKFWASYLNPTTPSAVGTSVEIEENIIAKEQGDAINQEIVFTQGVATVSVNYPDAGQIQIHARDDAGIGAPPASPDENDELQGSVSTIVNPFKLVISTVAGNPAESTSYNPITGNGFQRAAVRSHSPLVDVDTFDITVKAVIDCSNDPLKHCSGAETPTAASFYNDITLLPSLVFPSSASGSLGTIHSEDGAYTDDSTILTQSMAGGETTYSGLSYDEVGVLGLEASSIDYILPSNDISASDVKEIGRFYPAYIAYDNYSYGAACGDFSYMTEGLATDIPFAQSAVTVSYVMQAKAQASSGEAEKTTLNYDSGIGYPIAPNANFSDKAYSQNGLIDLSSRILPSSYYDQTLWQSGVYTLTALEVGLQKSLTTADGPYFLTMPNNVAINDQVEYFIKLAGIDGEKLQTDATTLCTTDQCRLPADTNLSSLGDFAYGRLQAGNGHGSEFQPIRTLIEATYFDGRQFVPFSRDACTPIVNQQLSATPTMSASNEIIVGSGKSKLTIQNSPLISGKSYFEFSAPDSRGKLDYFIRLKDLANTGLYAPWLLDSGNAVTCPGETGGLTDCISGYVEFGLFRGNDRVIYRMQTFE